MNAHLLDQEIELDIDEEIRRIDGQYKLLEELDEDSKNNHSYDYYDEIIEDEEDQNITPYIDLFFPFIIEQEHRLSEQAVVLSGESV